MARYLVLWEVDSTRVPLDAKERGTAWLAMHEMVKADMKKGLLKDWGSIPGALKGYAIGEGTELDMAQTASQYVPYAKFEIRPVLLQAQDEQLIRSSMKTK